MSACLNPLVPFRAENRLRNGVVMTRERVTSLCTAGMRALSLGHSRFQWHGKWYAARETPCRLEVDSASGEAIACRWY